MSDILQALAMALGKKTKWLVITAWTMSNVGWLGFMYFWWISFDMTGIAMSLLLVTLGDLMDVYLL
jgi:hypothetical protein